MYFININNKKLEKMEEFEIYFKANLNKIKDNNKFFNQLQKVSDYIIKRKNINCETLNVNFGTIGDDFIKNKITIKLTYNLKN
jgi:GMP synthase PP-ATPase subunit